MDNDIRKTLPYPWRSDKDAYLITQLRHSRPLRHTWMFGSCGMLDSAANLLISWILRDGGKIETTKMQNGLLYHSSTQHRRSAPDKLPSTWRDFFLKFNASILWTNGWKYDMGCYIKMQIFDLKKNLIILSPEWIDRLFTCWTDFAPPKQTFPF